MELTTRRFLLRDFVDDDLAAFVEYQSDPRASEFYEAGPLTPAQARELIATFRGWSAERPRRHYQFAIVRRDAAGALIGSAGVRHVDAAAGTGELGIELAPVVWGRHGYAVELLRAIVDFGFGALGLRTLYGLTVGANVRVARLMHAFGAAPTSRPGPAWMQEKGWHEMEWRLTKDRARHGRIGRTPGHTP